MDRLRLPFSDADTHQKDLIFYAVYTILFAAVIILSDVVNGIVGHNYAWFDVHFYWEHARDIMNGLVPYVDFDTAYPPFSFVIYLIPYLFLPGETEFNYGFAIFTYIFTMFAIYGLLKFSDKHDLDHKYVYLTFTLLVLGLNNFFIARNDTITTAFVVFCLLFYFDKKYLPAFVCLALGIMTKIYPIILLPVLLIPFLAERDWKGFLKYGLVTAGVCLLIELPFLINDPSTAFSYLFQHSNRGIEIESLIGIPLLIISYIDPSLAHIFYDESWDLAGPLPDAIAPLMMPLTFAVIGLFCIYFFIRVYKSRPEREKMLALTVMACACALMLFLVFNKVFCAQYLMWVIILYPMLIYAYRVFGESPKNLFALMILMTASMLLSVAFMSGSTEEPTILYILAMMLKAVFVIALTYKLLTTFRKWLGKCMNPSD